jgi:hypothetical protein
MPELTIHYQDNAARLLLEQAIAYVTQLHQVALDAPHGSVLHTCENLALSGGRALLRDTLATALEARIGSAELKGGPLVSAPITIPLVPKAGTNASS